MLTGIHPALERAIGSKITHRAVLEILAQCGGPTGIRAAGTDTVAATAAETVLPQLAESLKTVLSQRTTLAAQVEELLDAHPLARGPDLHAAHGGQDRRPHPLDVSHRDTPGRLLNVNTSPTAHSMRYPRRVRPDSDRGCDRARARLTGIGR
ncbi:hypothetical protein GCM10009676_20130 [Prauserella halophila]|uniref:Uncharacterized protein n=1 Tax=Prauserella halophila TaxID=185641 RepID=A0ABP4GT45_9PSEU